jgi:hypothetical protein
MHWDYKDQLRQTDLGGGGTAFYVYDASGQRVRKVWEKVAPASPKSASTSAASRSSASTAAPSARTPATLERETLHVMDDKQRIALVETRTLDTAGNDQAPRQLIRYQFGNHLGSASLELDEQAQIISYEEYAPYGSSTYQAVRSQTETPKRYRYTGKERDEESGLYYHGARYYLARSEAAGGHLVARHVGKSTADLAARLVREQRIPAASTFNSLAEAEAAVGGALQTNASRVANWVAGGARGRLTLDAAFSGGSVLARGASTAANATGVRVILQGNGSGGWHVLTGFPTP